MDITTVMPNYVYEIYNQINTSDLVVNNNFSDSNIKLFESLINNAQPRNINDKNIRRTIYYLYKKQPVYFYKYLVRARLIHLILWTDAKCIINHFNLTNKLFIRWDNGYKCNLFKKQIYNIKNLDYNEYKSINDRLLDKNLFDSFNIYDKLQCCDSI